jgi:hypothetical protein
MRASTAENPVGVEETEAERDRMGWPMYEAWDLRRPVIYSK